MDNCASVSNIQVDSIKQRLRTYSEFRIYSLQNYVSNHVFQSLKSKSKIKILVFNVKL